ncbi:hypothetical protein JCM4914_35710 [Streptomyces platensis subsp. malvinus]
MPPRQQHGVTRTNAAAYRSSSCQIGRHCECAQSSPAAAPIGIPVVYEVCDCSCHAAADHGNGTGGPR